MASLGLVTPGAATEGVTPLFFHEKPGDLFLVASSAVSPLISSSQKLTTFFCSSLYRFLLLSLGGHPPRGCHPTPFLPVRPRFSTILCKFAHKIFFLQVSPPWRVSRGAVRPPPPPSDATVFSGRRWYLRQWKAGESSRECVERWTVSSGNAVIWPNRLYIACGRRWHTTRDQRFTRGFTWHQCCVKIEVRPCPHAIYSLLCTEYFSCLHEKCPSYSN